jgi:cytochrome c5
MRLSIFFALTLVLAGPAVSSALARSGQDIYETTCFVCHMTGAAGAPKFDDRAAWASRLETGRETLFISVRNGKNAMPPKGTCVDCSTEELRRAVDYIISQVK